MMDTNEFYNFPIGYITTQSDLICVECASEEERIDLLDDSEVTYLGYPDGFTCVECCRVIPCDPKLCTCEGGQK